MYCRLLREETDKKLWIHRACGMHPNLHPIISALVASENAKKMYAVLIKQNSGSKLNSNQTFSSSSSAYSSASSSSSKSSSIPSIRTPLSPRQAPYTATGIPPLSITPLSPRQVTISSTSSSSSSSVSTSESKAASILLRQNSLDQYGWTNSEQGYRHIASNIRSLVQTQLGVSVGVVFGSVLKDYFIDSDNLQETIIIFFLPDVANVDSKQLTFLRRPFVLPAVKPSSTTLFSSVESTTPKNAATSTAAAGDAKSESRSRSGSITSETLAFDCLYKMDFSQSLPNLVTEQIKK